MPKRVDVEELGQWTLTRSQTAPRDQRQIDTLEVLYQCFLYVTSSPQASRRLLVLRDSETPWATCLQVLQREFPNLGYHFPAPKVPVVPPTV